MLQLDQAFGPAGAAPVPHQAPNFALAQAAAKAATTRAGGNDQKQDRPPAARGPKTRDGRPPTKAQIINGEGRERWKREAAEIRRQNELRYAAPADPIPPFQPPSVQAPALPAPNLPAQKLRDQPVLTEQGQAAPRSLPISQDLWDVLSKEQRAVAGYERKKAALNKKDAEKRAQKRSRNAESSEEAAAAGTIQDVTFLGIPAQLQQTHQDAHPLGLQQQQQQQQQFQQPQFQPMLGITIAPQYDRTFAEETRQAGPIGMRRLPDDEAVRPYANPVPQGSFNTAGSYNDRSDYGQLGGDGGEMEYTDEDWGEYGHAFIGNGYNLNAHSHQGRERKSKTSSNNRKPFKNDRTACQEIKDRRGQLSSSSESTSLESLTAEMEATSITGKSKKPFDSRTTKSKGEKEPSVDDWYPARDYQPI